MTAHRPGAVLAVALAVALGACGDGTGDAAPDVDPTGDATPTAPDGDAAAAGAPVEVSTLDGGDCPGDTASADHPDVVGARLTPTGEPGAWEVAVTLCSLYDGPERHADAWRVTTEEGDVLGTRELLHDHAGEQPFTRSLGMPLTVPDGVTTVVVEARDLVHGWGGATLTVDLTSG